MDSQKKITKYDLKEIHLCEERSNLPEATTGCKRQFVASVEDHFVESY